jgi:hypothetical protein
MERRIIALGIITALMALPIFMDNSRGKTQGPIKVRSGAVNSTPMTVLPCWTSTEPVWKKWNQEADTERDWEEFQEDHPEYLTHETEVYRRGQKSVERFYTTKNYNVYVH